MDLHTCNQPLTGYHHLRFPWSPPFPTARLQFTSWPCCRPRLSPCPKAALGKEEAFLPHCSGAALRHPARQQRANLESASVIRQRRATPGLSDLRVGQRRRVAGPAFVFIHLHADRCQQSNKFRVYGHKRQPFTCKYDCWARGEGGGGLKTTPSSLRAQSRRARACVTAGSSCPCLSSGSSEGANATAGLHPLKQTQIPDALAYQEGSGWSV